MPYTATMALNHLKGGPLERITPNFDIFTTPMTDQLIKKEFEEKNNIFLLTDQQLNNIVEFNAFTSHGPVITNSAKQTSDCVFLAPSLLNHSC